MAGWSKPSCMLQSMGMHAVQAAAVAAACAHHLPALAAAQAGSLLAGITLQALLCAVPESTPRQMVGLAFASGERGRWMGRKGCSVHSTHAR